MVKSLLNLWNLCITHVTSTAGVWITPNERSCASVPADRVGDERNPRCVNSRVHGLHLNRRRCHDGF